jgi:hypothetical protein
MFITRAIERGVDVKVIAEWQGYKDGGKLILDTYSAVTESRLPIFLRVFGIRGRPLQSYVNGCDASRSRLRKSNRSV